MSIIRKLLVALVVFVVVLLGAWFYLSSTATTDVPIARTEGTDVTLVEAKPQSIPRVNISSNVGWAADTAPKVAAGLAINRFATGLAHPRTMLTLPNGDVIVAETDGPASQGGGIYRWIEQMMMRRMGAGTPSPNRLILLRDADGDGVAEQRFELRKDGLDSPSGLAWGAGKLYVANHNAVLAFDYVPGGTALTGQPRKIVDLPGGGNHWMRNLLLSADGKLLYVAVGSASNIGGKDMTAEKGRAAIYEIDLATSRMRLFAGGLRNPNGLDWNPASGELWTTVNERDALGPDLVPDYLTNVPIGAHYGWPWYYWRTYMDERVEAPIPQYIGEYVRKPEYALGAHTASLGMRFAAAGNRLGLAYDNGAFVARHGSWNRDPVSGYDVVFIKFDTNGNPRGQPTPVLTGFYGTNGKIHGRPTWLAFDKTGALLVSDDTAGIIWRVIAPGAAPNVGIKPVSVGKIPPRRAIDNALDADFQRKIEDLRGDE